MRLPAKIDHSLIADLDEENPDIAIVELVLQIAS